MDGPILTNRIEGETAMSRRTFFKAQVCCSVLL